MILEAFPNLIDSVILRWVSRAHLIFALENTLPIHPRSKGGGKAHCKQENESTHKLRAPKKQARII